MVKILQIAGGTRAQQNAFIGETRELTVDTEGHELRLHDGVQVGGHRILSIESNDLRYSLKNTDLDAIAALPKTTGFIVKKGQASYALRILKGTAGQVTVTNGSGFTGDPVVSLSNVITKVIEFSNGINASGGVTGNLTGNVTGNLTGDSAGTHTGAVTGNVTGNLTGNAAGAHSGSFAGDIDVQGQTLLLDDAQIPLAKINGSFLAPEGPGTIPIGGIIEWSGSVASIPTNYQLCDGTGITPDLRDAFIVGAGDIGATFQVGDTGGSTTHDHGGTLTAATAGAHGHAITVANHTLTKAQLPAVKLQTGLATNFTAASHNGNGTVTSNGQIVDMDGKSGTVMPLTEAMGDGDSHPHTASSDNTGDHGHDVSIPSASNLPTFYALAKIMRIT